MTLCDLTFDAVTLIVSRGLLHTISRPLVVPYFILEFLLTVGNE